MGIGSGQAQEITLGITLASQAVPSADRVRSPSAETIVLEVAKTGRVDGWYRAGSLVPQDQPRAGDSDWAQRLGATLRRPHQLAQAWGETMRDLPAVS